MNIINMRFTWVIVLSGCLILPVSANSFRVEITGGTSADGLWDITLTEKVAFDSISTLLTSQPWFGDNLLAQKFALALGDSLGLPNFDDRGPRFVNFSNDAIINYLFYQNTEEGGTVILGGTSTSSTQVFAIAEPASLRQVQVPYPLYFSWLLAGLFALVGYRRLYRFRNDRF